MSDQNCKGRNVVQLETPAAMAIHSFTKSGGMIVPRARYRPVKTTSELLQAQSELYELYRGMLVMNPKREPATVPLVKLGEEFRTVTKGFCSFWYPQLEEYEKRFASIPNILELDHLTVSGDVRFGKDVTLKVGLFLVGHHNLSVGNSDYCRRYWINNSHSWWNNSGKQDCCRRFVDSWLLIHQHWLPQFLDLWEANAEANIVHYITKSTYIFFMSVLAVPPLAWFSINKRESHSFSSLLLPAELKDPVVSGTKE